MRESITDSEKQIYQGLQWYRDIMTKIQVWGKRERQKSYRTKETWQSYRMTIKWKKHWDRNIETQIHRETDVMKDRKPDKIIIWIQFTIFYWLYIVCVILYNKNDAEIFLAH